MNNPLMYNDPSGEFFFFGVLAAWLGSKLLAATIIGAVIGLASYTVGVLVSTGSLQSWNIGGALKATFFGAVGGAVTFGIGSIFQTSQGAFTALGSILDKAGVLPLVQAGAHGISQGVLSLMQGGDFLSGAAAGFLGSLGASGFGIIAGEAANSAVGTIAFGALSGGIGAELTGGNFWQGAVTGGIVAGLNHLAHSGSNNSVDNDDEYLQNADGSRTKVGTAGGDQTDYLYKGNFATDPKNWELIGVSDVKTTYGWGSNREGYGYRHYYKPQGGALCDPSFDMMSSYVGGAALGRFVSGAKFIFKTKVGGQFSLGYLDKPTKFMIRFEKHSLPKIGGGRGYPVHFNIEKMGSFNKHIFPNIKDWGKYKVR